jgi:hypothetical protein
MSKFRFFLSTPVWQTLRARPRLWLSILGALLLGGYLLTQFPSPFDNSPIRPGDRPFGYDALSYWLARAASYQDNLTTSGLGVWRYAPFWLPVLAVAQGLPFTVFAYLFSGLELAALVYLTRRWLLVAVLFVPVCLELYEGNIYLVSAALLIFILTHSRRYPVLAALWSFYFLTKVTPFLLVSWYLFRREWRPLAWALGVSTLILGLGLFLDPHTWTAWLSSLVTTQTIPDYAPFFGLGLPWRLALALGLIAAGARTNRTIFLVPALLLTMPAIWWHTYSLLIALYAADRLDQKEHRVETPQNNKNIDNSDLGPYLGPSSPRPDVLVEERPTTLNA